MVAIDTCLVQLKSYLDSDQYRQPMFVNVDTHSDLQQIKDEVPDGVRRISVADFCKEADQVPSIDVLLDSLSRSKEKILLTDFISALELQGDNELRKALSSLSSLLIEGKLIILCYQGMRYFNDFKDPRRLRRLIQVDGRIVSKPKLVFISPELAIDSMKPQVKSIQSLIRRIETAEEEYLYVVTEKHKDDFPSSSLFITELANAYDVLSEMAAKPVAGLDQKLGSADQWKELLKRCGRQGRSWQKIIQSELGTDENLQLIFQKWNGWDPFKQWLYFLCLKKNSGMTAEYLYYAASKAECAEELPRALFRSLLDFPPTSREFSCLYRERKELLKSFQGEEAVDFCLFVKSKNRDAIYYLTDNTQPEQEEIIACLANYDYSPKEIAQVLSVVSHQLSEYLEEYHFDNPLLNDYFSQYKLQKLTNRIYPEFETLVNQQAVERSYNLFARSRSSVVEKIDPAKTCAYWVDAMGLEYLGFIMKQCQGLGLMADISICRANLPTITHCNKDFVEEFQSRGIAFVSVKDLDEVKHHGKDQYNYEKTKLPLHLSKELEILSQVLSQAAQKLKSGSYDRVVLVSDHGASRLAVIKENTIDIEVDAKGTHGGRCCAYKESLPKIETATIEDDYYVLAGYDRFKGGRKASVETHGGATLEEVLVPVIELKLRDSNIEVLFLNPKITVSFRKKAAISLFSKTKLDAVSMQVDGNFYSGKEDGNNWYFEMPDITRRGEHKADIYSNNNLIKSGLSFWIEKEGTKENSLL